MEESVPFRGRFVVFFIPLGFTTLGVTGGRACSVLLAPTELLGIELPQLQAKF